VQRRTVDGRIKLMQRDDRSPILHCV